MQVVVCRETMSREVWSGSREIAPWEQRRGSPSVDHSSDSCLFFPARRGCKFAAPPPSRPGASLLTSHLDTMDFQVQTFIAENWRQALVVLLLASAAGPVVRWLSELLKVMQQAR